MRQLSKKISGNVYEDIGFEKMNLPKNQQKNINDWTKLFNDIVKNYKCPVECNGGCCRESVITFSEPGFKTIIKQRRDLKETLEQNVLISSEIIAGTEVKQYEITVHPCPLLEKGRCSSYNLRSIICKMYPFKSNSNTVPGMVTIDACPVGSQIALDFVIFKTIANTDPDTNSYDFDVNELIHLKQMMEDSKEYKTDVDIKNIQIPIEFLGMFEGYLRKSRKELLLSDRQLLINEINNLNV